LFKKNFEQNVQYGRNEKEVKKVAQKVKPEEEEEDENEEATFEIQSRKKVNKKTQEVRLKEDNKHTIFI